MGWLCFWKVNPWINDRRAETEWCVGGGDFSKEETKWYKEMAEAHG
jgi:hypothetical protein